MMTIKRFVIFISFWMLTFTFCKAQIMIDTIFSGKTRFVDLSGSKVKSLSESFQKFNLCTSQPFNNSEGVHKKANVPFLLQYYSKRYLNKSLLNEYDALIYASLCGHYEFRHETFIFEIFFEDDQKAVSYLKSLDKLNKHFEYGKTHDLVEIKDELVAALNPNIFFYKRKGNVIYVFHKILAFNDDLSTTWTLKSNFLEFLNNIEVNH